MGRNWTASWVADAVRRSRSGVSIQASNVSWSGHAVIDDVLQRVAVGVGLQRPGRVLPRRAGQDELARGSRADAAARRCHRSTPETAAAGRRVPALCADTGSPCASSRVVRVGERDSPEPRPQHKVVGRLGRAGDEQRQRRARPAAARRRRSARSAVRHSGRWPCRRRRPPARPGRPARSRRPVGSGRPSATARTAPARARLQSPRWERRRWRRGAGSTGGA